MTESHYTRYDRKRLCRNRRRLAAWMLRRGFKTPYEAAAALGVDNPGSITSHLRDLKASGFYTLERIRLNRKGLHAYRLRRNTREQLPLFRKPKAA